MLVHRTPRLKAGARHGGLVVSVSWPIQLPQSRQHSREADAELVSKALSRFRIALKMTIARHLYWVVSKSRWRFGS